MFAYDCGTLTTPEAVTLQGAELRRFRLLDADELEPALFPRLASPMADALVARHQEILSERQRRGGHVSQLGLPVISRTMH